MSDPVPFYTIALSILKILGSLVHCVNKVITVSSHSAITQAKGAQVSRRLYLPSSDTTPNGSVTRIPPEPQKLFNQDIRQRPLVEFIFRSGRSLKTFEELGTLSLTTHLLH